ncbi:MAG: hypothetical protein ACLT33_06900 [Lachnospira pectinoschiza]
MRAVRQKKKKLGFGYEAQNYLKKEKATDKEINDMPRIVSECIL